MCVCGGQFPRFVGRPPISWGSSQDVLGRRGQFRVSRSLPPYKAHVPSRDRPAPLILRRGPEWRLPHSDHLPRSGRAQLRWEGLLSSDLKYRSWKCPRGRCEFLLWGPALSGLPAPLGHLLKPKMPPPHQPRPPAAGSLSQPVILSGGFWRAGHRPLGVAGMV